MKKKTILRGGISGHCKYGMGGSGIFTDARAVEMYENR